MKHAWQAVSQTRRILLDFEQSEKHFLFVFVCTLEVFEAVLLAWKVFLVYTVFQAAFIILYDSHETGDYHPSLRIYYVVQDGFLLETRFMVELEESYMRVFILSCTQIFYLIEKYYMHLTILLRPRQRRESF